MYTLENIKTTDTNTFDALITYLEEKRLNCNTNEQFTLLNAEINAINTRLFEVGIMEVANAENPLAEIVACYSVAQFKAVDNTEKNNKIAFKDNAKIVKYSDIIRFMRKANKKEEIYTLPFTNAEITLINIYGNNISKIALEYCDCKALEILSRFTSDLECFKANSNTKIKEQLQVLFETISCKIGVTETVKAIEKHSKLINMEFVTYKSAKHTITINNEDKLIDLIINQYNISRNKLAITVKSRLAIHNIKKEENK